ncbi:hypothetical protein [Gordonia sp. (in: high G+C Gram-positive bacteria)]|uniref:hypothetical protein n=1 Tax=Gordonia sp. (in: high G+C Gram-positive bacteria) TaxID=84139 RepID=UPI003F96272A
MTTIKVTDRDSAHRAICEAAIPVAPRTDVDIYIDINQYRPRVSVYGLDPQLYAAQGALRDGIRVVTTGGQSTAFFRLDPAKPWIEQIEDIVDWLATESPVPA